MKLFGKEEERKPNTSRFMTGHMERDAPKEGVSQDLYKVTYNRRYCIGGDICTFIDPDHFILNKKDGKADFTGGKPVEGLPEGEVKFEMMVEDPTMNDIGGPLRRAADSCPAGVIRVVRVKDGRLVAGH